MLFRKFIVLVLILFLTGCASFYSPPYDSLKYYTKPEIGSELTVSLGEPLVVTENGYYADGLYLNGSGSTSRAIFWTIEINKGFYELVHSDDKYNYYFPEAHGMIKHYNRKEKIDNPSDLALRIGNNKSFGIVSNFLGGIFFNSKSLRKKLKIEAAENYFVLTRDSIQQAIIYNGKSGNTLNFTYRERSNNKVLPEFTNTISYDLDKSNIIGYKNFRAEIIETSNTEIKFKILQGFQ